MNERIRELAEQAKTETNKHFDSQRFDWADWEKLYDKKFAELIIWESVSIMINERQRQLGEFYTNVNGTANDFIHMSGASLTVDRIKQHFGIEK